jgi:hypothetical protein
MTVLTSGAEFKSRSDLRRLALLLTRKQSGSALDFEKPLLDALGAYRMCAGGQSHVVIPSHEAQTIADWSAHWSADLSAEIITSTRRCECLLLLARARWCWRAARGAGCYLAGWL